MKGICWKCGHTKADHGKIGLCPASIVEKYEESKTMTDKERLERLEKKVEVQDKLIDMLAAHIASQGKMSKELERHYEAAKIVLTGEGL
jgi:hypothetical protein